MSAIDRIVVGAAPGETRVACLAGGRLRDLFHERALSGAPPGVGTILAGRVAAIVPALDAAFVDLGSAGEGFLDAADAQAAARAAGRDASREAPIARLLAEGERIAVQVAAAATPGKAARLTTNLALHGRLLALTPYTPGVSPSRRMVDGAERTRLVAATARALEGGRGSPGAVLRSRAAGAAEAAVVGEATALLARWRGIERALSAGAVPGILAPAPAPLARVFDRLPDPLPPVVVDDRRPDRPAWRDAVALLAARGAAPERWGQAVDAFEELGIAAEIDRALARRVALAGGGVLAIDVAEALVAVDVDAGGRGAAATGSCLAAVNRSAAAELAVQLRLRRVAGLVLVDFLRAGRGRERLARRLAGGLADDAVETTMLGWTRGGLLELVRTRRDAPLAADLLDPASPGEPSLAAAALAALRRLAVAPPRGPARLILAPEVAGFLRGAGRAALDEATALLGSVDLRAAGSYRRGQVTVEEAGRA